MLFKQNNKNPKEFCWKGFFLSNIQQKKKNGKRFWAT